LHQNSGGVYFFPKPAGSVSERKPSEIHRDVRPAFSAGRSSWTFPSGIHASAYTNQYPYPAPLLPALSGKRESENLGGNYRENNEVNYCGALHDRFHLNVTVAHHPTGTSKWNPIEHRLFSEISKNWAGEPLDSYQKILNFIRTTSTRTGLAVSAYLDRRHYPIGAEPTPDQLQRLRLEPHDTLPKWNYTIKPNRV
jgi:hypothetical protein